MAERAPENYDQFDEQVMPEALTRRVAAWVAGLRHGDLPEPTKLAVRLAILDTLGASLHGIGQPWARAVSEWARRAVAAPGEYGASIWEAGEARLRPADAALVNGVAAHAFELVDFNA